MTAGQHSVTLQSGVLTVSAPGDVLARLDGLCDFASRQNPKRGFLFVSKVLGKHIPVRPRDMLATHQALARQVAPHMSGPTLFLGFAETATGLAAGVFEACCGLVPASQPLLYVQTTRYRLSAPLALDFHEEHSHASSHLVHEPVQRTELFHSAPTLVMVDDELSTGKTSVNFLREFLGVNPGVRKVVLVSLLNWMGGSAKRAFQEAFPALEVTFVSLLDGSYAFASHTDFSCPAMPSVTGNGAVKDSILPVSYGRLGETGKLAVHAEAAASRLALSKRRRVHVLGDGEFLHPPFLFASRLEQMGYDVRFQSTTRSPVLPGHAIEAKTRFTDHYGDGIENYAYNLPAESANAQLVLVHEVEGPLHLTRARDFQSVSYGELLCA